MSRRLRDLRNSVLILSNGAVWTRNVSLLKKNIRAHMGPYGPQPGPGPLKIKRDLFVPDVLEILLSEFEFHSKFVRLRIQKSYNFIKR